jgi:hypothetical protein
LKGELGCSVVAVDIDPHCTGYLSGLADRFVCGDIPGIGELLSLANAAEVEDRSNKVQRRFPRIGRALNAALDVQQRINRAGYVAALNSAGRLVRTCATGPFSNHVVMRAIADATRTQAMADATPEQETRATEQRRT